MKSRTTRFMANELERIPKNAVVTRSTVPSQHADGRIPECRAGYSGKNRETFERCSHVQHQGGEYTERLRSVPIGFIRASLRTVAYASKKELDISNKLTPAAIRHPAAHTFGGRLSLSNRGMNFYTHFPAALRITPSDVQVPQSNFSTRLDTIHYSLSVLMQSRPVSDQSMKEERFH